MTEQQKQQFLTLTRDAIHFITFRSHNIDEIWATLTSLWEKYYTSNEIKLSPKFLEIEISSIFRQPTFHTLDVSLIPKDSTTSSSSGTILKRNLSVHSNDSMDSNVSSMMKPSLNFNSVINQNTCE